ncbi:MAG: hypothetical protein A2506_12225 [Elusimicrobia bacterium RIFOXYD12_FULL_66_9]|nr:MAG: hypothetical protein A2506_12225 [Elusimicrobia bacterium RIFOXYD12_FULL_66_9]
MEKQSFETILRALDQAGVRYLIVGGLAVVAHGFVRFTADLDLILDLEPQNLKMALPALSRLGYRPRAPVDIDDFAVPAIRRSWIEEKGMKVFSLSSSEHAATEIDIFAEAPFDFAAAYSDAARLEVCPGVTATFVDFDRLLALKKQAGRPQDLQDVEQLKALRKESLDG